VRILPGACWLAIFILSKNYGIDSVVSLPRKVVLLVE